MKFCIGFCFGISTTEAQCFEYGFRKFSSGKTDKAINALKESREPNASFKYFLQLFFLCASKYIDWFRETGVNGLSIHRAFEHNENPTTLHIELRISTPNFVISILTDKGFATIAHAKFVEYLCNDEKLRMTKWALIGWQRNEQVP